MKVATGGLRGAALALAILAVAAAGDAVASSWGYDRSNGQGYGGSDGERYGSGLWPALSDGEMAALSARLGLRSPLSVVLVYRPSRCAALQQSLGKLFDGLNWPRADAQGSLLDQNPDGLTLLPDNPNTRDLKDAIQTATRLRVAIRDAPPSALGPGAIILVIGGRPEQTSGRVVRSIDGGCQ